MTRRAVIVLCAAVAALIVPVAGPRAQTPVPTASSRVVKIVGNPHHLLLRADGTVAGWGQYKHGQLGPVAAITATPRGASNALIPIALPAKAFDIAANRNTSYALLDDGTVVAWGRGDNGQLGIGPAKPPKLATSEPSFEYRGIETPTRVGGVDDAIAIAAANDSAMPCCAMAPYDPGAAPTSATAARRATTRDPPARPDRRSYRCACPISRTSPPSRPVAITCWR